MSVLTYELLVEEMAWVGDTPGRRKSKVGDLMNLYYDNQVVALPSPTVIEHRFVTKSFDHLSVSEFASAKAHLGKEILALQREADGVRYKQFKVLTQDVDRGRLVDFLDDIKPLDKHVDTGLACMDKLAPVDTDSLASSMGMINKLVKLQEVPATIRQLVEAGNETEAISVMKSVLTAFSDDGMLQYPSVAVVVNQVRALARELVERLILELKTDLSSFRKSVLRIHEICSFSTHFSSKQVMEKIVAVRAAHALPMVENGSDVEAAKQFIAETSQVLGWAWPEFGSSIQANDSNFFLVQVPTIVFNQLPAIEEFDDRIEELRCVFSDATQPSLADAIQRSYEVSVIPILETLNGKNKGQIASKISALFANRLIGPHVVVHEEASVERFISAVSAALHAISTIESSWEKLCDFLKLEIFLQTHSFPALHRLASPEMLTEIHMDWDHSSVWMHVRNRFVQTVSAEISRQWLARDSSRTCAYLETELARLDLLTDKRVSANAALAGSIVCEVLNTSLVQQFRSTCLTAEDFINVQQCCNDLVRIFPYPEIPRIAARIITEAENRLRPALYHS